MSRDAYMHVPFYRLFACFLLYSRVGICQKEILVDNERDEVAWLLVDLGIGDDAGQHQLEGVDIGLRAGCQLCQRDCSDHIELKEWP